MYGYADPPPDYGLHVCTVICAFLYTHILHMPTSLYVYTCTICKYIRKYLCVDRYVNYICGYICYVYIYIHIYNMDMYTYIPTYLQLLDESFLYVCYIPFSCVRSVHTCI